MLWLVLLIAIAVAAVGALAVFSGDGRPYRTTPELEIAAYLENSKSLRGNVYRVEGEILNSLARSPSSGRLISIGVDKGREVVPVLVTPDFDGINLQKGQKFIFLLEVDNSGFLRTKGLTKS
ncbi:MAG: hypothetical protein Fur0032_13120 [Terrimicrobiaceae bacterium]